MTLTQAAKEFSMIFSDKVIADSSLGQLVKTTIIFDGGVAIIFNINHNFILLKRVQNAP